MRNPSVLMPVGMALETIRRVLFQPFNFIKWLAIGFTAWLALLESGLETGFNFNPGQWNKGQTSQCGQVVWGWIQANLLLVIPLVILFCIVGVVFTLLVLWLSCRGKFMFLDNVVGNQAEILKPWHKFRAQGNSCFLFLICFGLVATAVLILGVGLAALVGWPDLSRSHFGWYAVAAVGVGAIFLLCFLITTAAIRAFLEDFVIPIMALRTCRIMEGWKVFFELFRKQVGIFILYLLFRTALGMAIGFITMFLCCLLCCTVLIPYVGTVLLLPIHVFWRSYSVHFLGQFNEKLKMFPGGQPSYITLSHKETY
ncbi:MAG: hypothetical protein Q7J98_14575 [Kiritimatiellia bacterium]|nr:hypothetical protein [Kiritimatiellia bacterium]